MSSSLLNIETYNGTINGNNINVIDSELIDFHSTDSINFTNINRFLEV